MNTTPQERLALGVTALLITAGAGVRMFTPAPTAPEWAGEMGIAADTSIGTLISDASEEASAAALRAAPLSRGGTIGTNRASVDQLQRLPGVGPALAERIVEWREESGRFRSLADLDRVSGIGPAMLENIAPHVALPAGAPGGPSEGGRGDAAPRLDLNSATAAELEALPGVGPVLAKRIIEWREKHGPFNGVAELDSVSGVGPALLAELTPLLRAP